MNLDKCQDWFHGKCVGILQSEADYIDEYICPNCQKNSSIDFANMKSLGSKEFEGLGDFLKEILVNIYSSISNKNNMIMKIFLLKIFSHIKVHGLLLILWMPVKFRIIIMS